MGGRGSGGRRTGSGRKQISDLELAIGGTRSGVVVPFSTSTAVAGVATFDPPPDLARPPLLEALTVALASADGEARARLQERVDELTVLGLEATTAWHDLAPHAFTARTLTPATTAVFVMLCRAIVRERALALTEPGGPDHRGLMQRISTWTKDFALAPLGKPLYAAEAPSTNPLDRFTRRATDVGNSASGGGGGAA